MFLNKKVVNLSRLDKIVKILKEEGKAYRANLIANIPGRCFSDVIPQKETYKHYQLRRLDYDNYIVVEQMICNDEEGLDDFIISRIYTKETVPKKWHYLINKSNGSKIK